MVDEQIMDHEPRVDDVISECEREIEIGNSRAAAELAYAVAMRAQAACDVRLAVEYSRKCYDLLASLPERTIEQVTSTRTRAGGVDLPELLHTGVVRARLGHWLQT